MLETIVWKFGEFKIIIIHINFTIVQNFKENFYSFLLYINQPKDKKYCLKLKKHKWTV